MKPSNPVITNAGRQLPSRVWSQIASGPATAPPTADPLSKIATAIPRSDFGNHSDTALVAPGQLAASPDPSRKRKARKLLKPVASDVAIATVEYHSTAKDNPRRVPRRSNMR